MSENKTNGQIQIADEVVGVIATTAALEVRRSCRRRQGLCGAVWQEGPYQMRKNHKGCG